MGRKPKVAKPISIDLDPIGKKTSDEKKLGLMTARKVNKKMLSIRLRPQSIADMKLLIAKLRRVAKRRFSQSEIVELAIIWAENKSVEELMDMYANSFRIRKKKNLY